MPNELNTAIIGAVIVMIGAVAFWVKGMLTVNVNSNMTSVRKKQIKVEQEQRAQDLIIADAVAFRTYVDQELKDNRVKLNEQELKINNMDTLNQQLSDKVHLLEKHLSEKEDNEEILNVQIIKMQEEIRDLQHKYEEVSKKNQTLIEQVNAGNLELLEKDKKIIERDLLIEQLKQQINELNEQIANLNIQINGLRQIIQTMQDNIDHRSITDG